MALAPSGLQAGSATTAGNAVESSKSAVSWAAIIAGALTATAVSLILLALGSGLGFAAASPWQEARPSAKAIAVTSIIWLVVMQWVSSGIGGYLTGRLRAKWVGTHTHEVFFRDTAHGLLSWAVATVVTVGLLTSATSSLVGGGVQATATIASGAAQAAAPALAAQAREYDIDTLFRRAQPDANAPAGDTRAEASRILAVTVTGGDVSPTDRAYLAQLVAARAGISEADAQKRVDETITKAKAAAEDAKQAADAARKAAATFALFTALSMLIGAFIASVAAALGGHQRDEH
ncbi:hypothetical protein ACFQS7_26445 [Dankookia sp. GCM10030260]|uniref:hypothetical protein n=1 Tax=Dankookia sp. GCM10030260 TaxID=3273390 RepID=UPI00360CB3BE